MFLTFSLSKGLRSKHLTVFRLNEHITKELIFAFLASDKEYGFFECTKSVLINFCFNDTKYPKRKLFQTILC